MLETIASSWNIRMKLPRPVNRSGGFNGWALKNASTSVPPAGNSARPMMKTASGATRAYGSQSNRLRRARGRPPGSGRAAGRVGAACTSVVTAPLPSVGSAAGTSSRAAGEGLGGRGDRLDGPSDRDGADCRGVEVRAHRPGELRVPGGGSCGEHRLRALQHGRELLALGELAARGQLLHRGEAGRRRVALHDLGGAVRSGPRGLVLRGRDPLDELRGGRRVLRRLRDADPV